MNKKLLIPFIALLSLSSCSNNVELSNRYFYFDTFLDVKMFEGRESDMSFFTNDMREYDALCDNYQARDLTNIYTINHTNEDVVLDSRLYYLLQEASAIQSDEANYFNYLCGSLAKKWKNALNSQQILDENEINNELEKMNNSSIIFKDQCTVQRVGEAEIDLGAVAKGFALDLAKGYFSRLNYKKYIVNAGNSSILLGEKNTNDGLFNIRIDDLENSYLKLKNCFVSTSSISVQGVTIGNVTYSHIINPITGSAINENDAVIVISDNGWYGDIMSTSMMMNTIEEIKAIELKCGIKAIVIREHKIVYKNESIEVYHR